MECLWGQFSLRPKCLPSYGFFRNAAFTAGSTSLSGHPSPSEPQLTEPPHFPRTPLPSFPSHSTMSSETAALWSGRSIVDSVSSWNIPFTSLPHQNLSAFKDLTSPATLTFLPVIHDHFQNNTTSNPSRNLSSINILSQPNMHYRIYVTWYTMFLLILIYITLCGWLNDSCNILITQLLLSHFK